MWVFINRSRRMLSSGRGGEIEWLLSVPITTETISTTTGHLSLRVLSYSKLRWTCPSAGTGTCSQSCRTKNRSSFLPGILLHFSVLRSPSFAAFSFSSWRPCIGEQGKTKLCDLWNNYPFVSSSVWNSYCGHTHSAQGMVSRFIDDALVAHRQDSNNVHMKHSSILYINFV